MEVVLSPDLEALVHDELESGRFASPTEVIAEALRRLRMSRSEDRETLRREIQVGVEDLEKGAFRDFDEATLSKLAGDIETRGLRRLKAR